MNVSPDPVIIFAYQYRNEQNRKELFFIFIMFVLMLVMVCMPFQKLMGELPKIAALEIALLIPLMVCVYCAFKYGGCARSVSNAILFYQMGNRAKCESQILTSECAKGAEGFVKILVSVIEKILEIFKN